MGKRKKQVAWNELKNGQYLFRSWLSFRSSKRVTGVLLSLRLDDLVVQTHQTLVALDHLRAQFDQQSQQLHHVLRRRHRPSIGHQQSTESPMLSLDAVDLGEEN